MLHCDEERTWRIWTGTHWAKQNSAAFRMATNTFTLFKEQAEKSKSEGKQALVRFANRALDHAKIKAALSTLEHDKQTFASRFDQSSHLLNFLNGTLDLKSGELRQHERDNLITKIVRHDYSPDAKAPVFLAFINRIMGGNQEMIGFLQRSLGYSMTGDTSERAIFLAHGTGTNGKSTLLDLVRDLISDYASKIMIDSLAQSGNGASTTALADLADLRGARFASTSEGESGQGFGAVLKRITQGNNGAIKTSRKYENPIEFRESHKLWLDTNHLPSLPPGDDALWNRLSYPLRRDHSQGAN